MEIPIDVYRVGQAVFVAFGIALTSLDFHFIGGAEKIQPQCGFFSLSTSDDGASYKSCIFLLF